MDLSVKDVPKTKNSTYAFEKLKSKYDYPSLKIASEQIAKETQTEIEKLNTVEQTNITAGWLYELKGDKEELTDLCGDVLKFAKEGNYFLLEPVLLMLNDCMKARCFVEHRQMTAAEIQSFYNQQKMIQIPYSQDQEQSGNQ